MTPTKKGKTTAKAKPELAGWVGIMRVAVIMSCRYQKARDMMLEGTFGKPYYTEDEGLMVEEKKVFEYRDREKTANAKS